MYLTALKAIAKSVPCERPLSEWDQISERIAQKPCEGEHHVSGCPWCQRRTDKRGKLVRSRSDTHCSLRDSLPEEVLPTDPLPQRALPTGAVDLPTKGTVSTHISFPDPLPERVLPTRAIAIAHSSVPVPLPDGVLRTDPLSGGSMPTGAAGSTFARFPCQDLVPKRSLPNRQPSAASSTGFSALSCSSSAGSQDSENKVGTLDVVHSLEDALADFRRFGALKANYAPRVDAAEILIRVCSKLPPLHNEAEAVLKEIWVELKRTVVNIQYSIAYKNKFSEKMILRHRIARLRRRLKRLARDSHALDLEASTSVQRPLRRENSTSEPPKCLEELRNRCEVFVATGSSRHLCEHMCYFREYDPARQLQTLRKRAKKHPVQPSVAGWTARLAVSTVSPYWCVVFHDAAGGVRGCSKDAWETLLEDVLDIRLPCLSGNSGEIGRGVSSATGGSSGIDAIESAVDHTSAVTSPFGLIEELFVDQPWRLLIACALLNKTGRMLVDRTLPAFFQKWPVPEVLATNGDKSTELENMLEPLGFHRRRSRMLVRFSQEYLDAMAREGNPLLMTSVKKLHGVGRYAADAYCIFVRRETLSVRPADIYLDWFTEFQACKDRKSLDPDECCRDELT